MSSAKESRLMGYYAELKKFIDSGNYPKIIKCANKILSESDKELKAWQCRVVALIQLDQFIEALTVIKKCKFPEQLIFEKAYCEYRLNDLKSAWDTISSTSENLLRVRELKAQMLYRLERYDECYAIYRDLVRTTSDDFDEIRQTNMAASAANRAYEGLNETKEVTIDRSTYELRYNGACELLAVGRLEEALDELRKAEESCRHDLAVGEGAPEEEINEEVAIIRVQQGHCLQLMGREKEALSVYNSVMKTKPEDAALLAIINNNVVAINRAANVFDSRKRIKVAMAAGLGHKLTSHQRGSIAFNQCLLAYHTNQDEFCTTELKKVAEQYPKLETSCAVVRAVLMGRSGKLDEAVAVMQAMQEAHPNEAAYAAFVAVQILLSQGALEKASQILSSLSTDIRYRAGVVSSMVTIYTALQNSQLASATLCDAVDWHKQNKTAKSQLTELWRHAADFHLRSGDPKTAAASLQELHRMNPSDVKTLAQLVIAFAQFDSVAAQKLSKELPPVNESTSKIDVDVLESSFGPRYMRKAVKVGEGSPASPSSPKSPLVTNEEAKKKAKKKRKPRLPKNYNPGVEPDPERWLPRWQRKGQKVKKKTRNKEVGRGTQGVASETADKYDITKTAGQYQTTQTNVRIQPEPSGPRRNFQKKKVGKRKKGR